MLACLVFAGCGGSPAPRALPPQLEIRLVADGAWWLDGRRFAGDAIDAELARRAAEAAPTRSGRTTLQARVRAAPEVAYERVLEAIERCQRAGIAHVEVVR